MDLKDFFIFFGLMIVLTIGVIVFCGIIIGLCKRLVYKLIGYNARYLVLATSIIGTPIHEIGHALMCLIFGHKITSITLLTFNDPDKLGEVCHSYSKRNVWQRLGCVFISLGPIFSCLGVILLTLWLCFPIQLKEYLDVSTSLQLNFTSIVDILKSSGSLLKNIVLNFNDNTVIKIIGVIILLSVVLHASLSSVDIKNIFKSIIYYLIFLLIVCVFMYICKINDVVIETMALFNVRLLAFFFLSIIFSFTWVVICFIFFIIRKILGR